jgi:hypothetical protein
MFTLGLTAIKSFLGGLNINLLNVGLIISLGVMSLLYQLEKTSHKLTVSQYATISASNAAVNAIQAKYREKITQERKTSFEKSLDEVSQYYAKNPTIKLRTIRVRDNTSCTTSTTERESTERVDTGLDRAEEVTATDTSGEVQIDFEKASKEIVQCLELIKFNKEQDAVE